MMTDNKKPRKILCTAQQHNRSFIGSNTHILGLPLEILTIIFSHLSVREKGRVAQVCKTWRDATDYKPLWRGVKVSLDTEWNLSSVLPSLVKRGIKRVKLIERTRSPEVNLAEVIRGIPNLELLDLSECECLSDDDITRAFVVERPSLLEMRLGGDGYYLTELSFKRIARYLMNLESFDLADIQFLRKDIFKVIGLEMKKLKRLNLSFCDDINDQGIAYLAHGNDALEELHLSFCHSFTRQFNSVMYLSKLISLKKLHLSGTALTDNGMSYLANLVNLQELYLNECEQITDNGFISLMKLTKLHKLNLSCCTITGNGLRYLSKASNLRELDLSYNNNISDDGLACLTNFINLEKLNISGCNITDRFYLLHSKICVKEG